MHTHSRNASNNNIDHSILITTTSSSHSFSSFILCFLLIYLDCKLNRWKRINARGMKSGTWGEAEERRLVGAVVAHEHRGEQQQGGSGSGSRNKTKKAGDQTSLWNKISECVPQRLIIKRLLSDFNVPVVI